MSKLLPVLLLLLSACAPQAVTVGVPGLERSAATRLQDLRPETEKQAETFSIAITSEAYALYRLADASVAPPAARLLQHRAFEKFGAAAPEIRLHHLVVYRNLQAEFRRTTLLGSIGGAVGAAIAGPVTTDPSGVASSLTDGRQFSSFAGSQEYKRALYTAQENPGRGSVLIVFIETEIGGKRTFTRSVGPSARDGKDLLGDTVESAIRFHLSHTDPIGPRRPRARGSSGFR